MTADDQIRELKQEIDALSQAVLSLSSQVAATTTATNTEGSTEDVSRKMDRMIDLLERIATSVEATQQTNAFNPLE